MSSATIGAIIRAIRLEQEISARWLAKHAGCGPSALSLIESGNRNPSLDMLRAIAGGLGVPLSEIFRAEETGGWRAKRSQK